MFKNDQRVGSIFFGRIALVVFVAAKYKPIRFKVNGFGCRTISSRLMHLSLSCAMTSFT